MKRINKQGIFIGGSVKQGMTKPEYTIYGYIKPEDDRWVAVCVNMCLVSQGKTPSEALEKMIESAESYIRILKRNFPKKWKSKIEQQAPLEFYTEFLNILKQLKPLLELSSKPIPKRSSSIPDIMPYLKPNIMQGNIFVQPISANYA